MEEKNAKCLAQDNAQGTVFSSSFSPHGALVRLAKVDYQAPFQVQGLRRRGGSRRNSGAPPSDGAHGGDDTFAGEGDPGDSPPPPPSGGLTIQRSHRLVSLAVRRVTLAGAMSGGAWRVWIFLEGWLAGLVPTMFTWRMRKLVGWGEGHAGQ